MKIYSTGSILANDEPVANYTLADNLELKDRLQKAYLEFTGKEGEEGEESTEVKVENVPELLNIAGYEFDDQMVQELMEKFFTNDKDSLGATESSTVSEEAFLSFVERFQAPGNIHKLENRNY